MTKKQIEATAKRAGIDLSLISIRRSCGTYLIEMADLPKELSERNAAHYLQSGQQLPEVEKLIRKYNRDAKKLLKALHTAHWGVMAGYPTLSRLTALKKRWRVSISSMVMYCNSLGIIDETRKQYFFREMTRMKMRKQEPYDDELPVEHSSLLLSAEKLIVEAGIFTREKLFELSCLNASDYCELLDAPSDYLKPVPVKPRLRLV